MHILITNDDGIEAAGIKALTRAVRSLRGVSVTVVAPHREQSATSHSLTLHRPLRIIRKKRDIFAVDGTPTDCVMIGTSRICKIRPDMILSGINHGGNVGDDVHYSGTVAAAIEGGLMGIPSIAISQLSSPRSKMDFTVAARFARHLVGVVKKNGLRPGIVLNVNVPAMCKRDDFEVTVTGKRDYGDIYVEAKDPRGQPYYWIGGNSYAFFPIPHSDGKAIMAGKISVTPLDVNMTSRPFIKRMKRWKW